MRGAGAHAVGRRVRHDGVAARVRRQHAVGLRREDGGRRIGHARAARSAAVAVAGGDLRVLAVAGLVVVRAVGEGVLAAARAVGVEEHRVLAVAVEVAARRHVPADALAVGRVDEAPVAAAPRRGVREGRAGLVGARRTEHGVVRRAGAHAVAGRVRHDRAADGDAHAAGVLAVERVRVRHRRADARARVEGVRRTHGEAVVGDDLRVLVVASLRVEVGVAEGVLVLARLVGVVAGRGLAVHVEVARRNRRHRIASRISEDAVLWVHPTPVGGAPVRCRIQRRAGRVGAVRCVRGVVCGARGTAVAEGVAVVLGDAVVAHRVQRHDQSGAVCALELRARLEVVRPVDARAARVRLHRAAAVRRDDLRVLLVAGLRVLLAVGERVGVAAGVVGVVERCVHVIDVEVAARVRCDVARGGVDPAPRAQAPVRRIGQRSAVSISAVRLGRGVVRGAGAHAIGRWVRHDGVAARVRRQHTVGLRREGGGRRIGHARAARSAAVRSGHGEGNDLPVLAVRADVAREHLGPDVARHEGVHGWGAVPNGHGEVLRAVS